MPMLLPPKEADFELPPADTHLAVCYRVIDLGTQMTEWMGQKKPKHKIQISWELSECFMTQGKAEGLPFSIHKRYTYSSSENAHLRKDLESWRGRKFGDEDFGTFDIAKLLGVGCYLGVVHSEGKNGKTYVNISSIMRLPKDVKPKQPINPTVYLNLQEFNKEVYDQLSDNMKATIAQSPEFQELMGANVRAANVDHDDAFQLNDDIPF